MTKHYEPELKQEIIRLYLEEGRTIQSLTAKYNLGKGILRYWLKNTRKECDIHQTIAVNELVRLCKQNASLRKENDFLKKRQHSLPRKSNSPISTHPEISQEVWCALAAAKISHEPNTFIYGNSKMLNC